MRTTNVRFGSLADIAAALPNVRFSPGMKDQPPAGRPRLATEEPTGSNGAAAACGFTAFAASERHPANSERLTRRVTLPRAQSIQASGRSDF